MKLKHLLTFVAVASVGVTALTGSPSAQAAFTPPPGVESFVAEYTATGEITFRAETMQMTQREMTLTDGATTMVNRNDTDESGRGGSGFLGRTGHTMPFSDLTPGRKYEFVATFTTAAGVKTPVQGRITVPDRAGAVPTAGPAPTAPPTPNEPQASTLFSYDEPKLENPKTYVVAAGAATVKIPAGQDAIVKTETPLVNEKGGIQVFGGRNVVIDAEVHFTQDLNSGQNSGMDNRGLYIRGGGGGNREVFVRRFVLTGEHVKEGIQISTDEKNVTVTVNYYDASGAAFRAAGTHHPDVIQAWSGPKTLRINRVWAPVTDFQGFFLQQAQYGEESGYEVFVDNVYLGGSAKAAYLLWDNHSAKVHVGVNAPNSVYVDHKRFGQKDGRIFWDAANGGAGRGVAWENVLYGERTKAQVLG